MMTDCTNRYNDLVSQTTRDFWNAYNKKHQTRENAEEAARMEKRLTQRQPSGETTVARQEFSDFLRRHGLKIRDKAS